MNKCVSIVIRTKNEEELIEEVLKSIKTQTYTDYEIILVDSGSTDLTLEIAKKYGCKILNIKPEEFTFGYAINYGFENSKGDYLCLVSGHAPPYDKYWLENFVKALESDKSIMGCYGGVKPLPNANLYAARDSYNYSIKMKKDINGTETFSNANSIVKREMWNEVKFDENLTASEDRYWAGQVVSLGYKVKHVENSIVYHSHNETCKQINYRSFINAKAASKIDATKMFKKQLLRGYVSNVVNDCIFGIKNDFFNYFINILFSPVYRFCQFYGLYKGNQ